MLCCPYMHMEFIPGEPMQGRGLPPIPRNQRESSVLAAWPLLTRRFGWSGRVYLMPSWKKLI